MIRLQTGCYLSLVLLVKTSDNVRFVSIDIEFGVDVCHLHLEVIFYCCQRCCADVDDVWSVTPAYILHLCEPTDFVSSGTPIGDQQTFPTY